jgi:hypothetical protein
MVSTAALNHWMRPIQHIVDDMGDGGWGETALAQVHNEGEGDIYQCRAEPTVPLHLCRSEVTAPRRAVQEILVLIGKAM